jgi:hypothetical protein
MARLQGKGYGKQMLQLAIQEAINEFGAKKKKTVSSITTHQHSITMSTLALR